MDDIDLHDALRIVRQVVYSRTIESVELVLGQTFDQDTLQKIAAAYDVLHLASEADARKLRAN